MTTISSLNVKLKFQLIRTKWFVLDEGVANATGDMVQEEIEVMDQEMQNVSQPFSVMYTPSPMTLNRRATFNDPRSVVNLQELYEEMSRYAPAMSIGKISKRLIKTNVACQIAFWAG